MHSTDSLFARIAAGFGAVAITLTLLVSSFATPGAVTLGAVLA